MSAQTRTSFTPSVVRRLMPEGYLKQIQEQHKKATGREFSDAMISYVVKNGRTTHVLWPLVLKLARKEMRRLTKEQQQAADHLKALQA